MILEAAFSYQNACSESELVTVKLAQLGNMSEIDSFVLACALADERVSGEGQLEANLLETVGEKFMEDGPAYDVGDLGHHGGRRTCLTRVTRDVTDRLPQPHRLRLRAREQASKRDSAAAAAARAHG